MTGPVKRANITVEVDDDGRTVHTFRQSTLGELDICAERGRLTMAGEMPRVESDAACLGTAVHAGIEAGLHDMLDDQGVNLEHLEHVAVHEFRDLVQSPDFAWIKYSPDEAEAFILEAVGSWYEHVMPTLHPLEVELGFGPLTIHEDDQRVIQLTGTIDYLDERLGLIDWKTSGDDRKYRRGFGGRAWEIDRWAIQPTVYVWAARQLGLLEDGEAWPFTFVAFHRGGYEMLEVERHVGDFAWLRDKCMSFAPMVEAELEVWPTNDNHALCSEKWCPAWGKCKGKNYEIGWPKPSAPKR